MVGLLLTVGYWAGHCCKPPAPSTNVPTICAQEDTSTVEKMVLERVALEQTMEDMGFALTSL